MPQPCPVPRLSIRRDNILYNIYFIIYFTPNEGIRNKKNSTTVIPACRKRRQMGRARGLGIPSLVFFLYLPTLPLRRK
jgi:hypothetical protein